MLMSIGSPDIDPFALFACPFDAFRTCIQTGAEEAIQGEWIYPHHSFMHRSLRTRRRFSNTICRCYLEFLHFCTRFGMPSARTRKAVYVATYRRGGGVVFFIMLAGIQHYSGEHHQLAEEIWGHWLEVPTSTWSMSCLRLWVQCMKKWRHIRRWNDNDDKAIAWNHDF